MTHHLMKCTKCQKYTLADHICPYCSAALEGVYPPKYSPEDKYQKYRLDYFRSKMVARFPDLAKN
jgi:H/ACA ribonucleoprotein complex subunit 3